MRFACHADCLTGIPVWVKQEHIWTGNAMPGGSIQGGYMLEARQVTEQTKDMGAIRRLYMESFPREERLPLEMLIHGGRGDDFCAVYDGDMFCGFFSLLSWQDISHITFLAVREDFQNRGYGTRILRLIRDDSMPGERIRQK